MKKIVYLVLAIWLIGGVCWAADKPVIHGEDDKISYSVGHQVGRDLVRQGVDVNSELILQGILDAIEKREPMIPFAQMIDTLAALRQRIVEQADKSNHNLRVMGKKFLEENAAKEGIVTLESGLQYKVLQEGTGKKPSPEDMVEVNYISKDIQGNVVDTSYRGGASKPAQFKVKNVIPGWLEALQRMPEGSKWEIYVPSHLAYRDTTPLAGQTVVFEIELVKVLN